MSGRRYLHCISRIECAPCTFSAEGTLLSCCFGRILGLLDSKVLSRSSWLLLSCVARVAALSDWLRGSFCLGVWFVLDWRLDRDCDELEFPCVWSDGSLVIGL